MISNKLAILLSLTAVPREFIKNPNDRPSVLAGGEHLSLEDTRWAPLVREQPVSSTECPHRSARRPEGPPKCETGPAREMAAFAVRPPRLDYRASEARHARRGCTQARQDRTGQITVHRMNQAIRGCACRTEGRPATGSSSSPRRTQSWPRWTSMHRGRLGNGAQGEG